MTDDSEIMSAINEMINTATNHNLLAEVVWSFGLDCAVIAPNTLEQWQACCEFALNEWDI